jgi:putative FmdB family regulatory protein
MPIFEYSCLKCGFRFEKVQQPGVVCLECGSLEVKKELSAFSTGASSSSACFSGG